MVTSDRLTKHIRKFPLGTTVVSGQYKEASYCRSTLHSYPPTPLALLSDIAAAILCFCGTSPALGKPSLNLPCMTGLCLFSVMEQLCQFACDCGINSKMIINELLIFKKEIKETELNICADRQYSSMVKNKLKDVCVSPRGSNGLTSGTIVKTGWSLHMLKP